jgi:phosphate transport system substrate-binding protein
MFVRRTRQLISLGLACLAATAIASAAVAEELLIPGSGNPEYLLAQLAKVFNQQQTLHRVSVPAPTGTAGALRALAEKTASVARVGRSLTEEERRAGVSYVPLGIDAVVFVAGAGVSVRGITSAQAVDIYTGKLDDWRQLGGKPGPIRAVGRETTDASRGAVAREIKAFEKMVFGEDVKVAHLDPQLIALLDRFPTSLGFLNRSALYAARTKVAALALNSVEPTSVNLESGRYPLRLELGLIYRADALTDAGRKFLEFVASPAAARIMREHGVVPLALKR